MKIKTYSKNEVVVPDGTPKGKYMWVIVKGRLMSNNQKIGDVFSCIGEN